MRGRHICSGLNNTTPITLPHPARRSAVHSRRSTTATHHISHTTHPHTSQCSRQCDIRALSPTTTPASSTLLMMQAVLLTPVPGTTAWACGLQRGASSSGDARTWLACCRRLPVMYTCRAPGMWCGVMWWCGVVGVVYLVRARSRVQCHAAAATEPCVHCGPPHHLRRLQINPCPHRAPDCDTRPAPVTSAHQPPLSGWDGMGWDGMGCNMASTPLSRPMYVHASSGGRTCNDSSASAACGVKNVSPECCVM